MAQSSILNVIDCPTGCGKTRFATEVIPTPNHRSRTLYLIDTINSRSEVLKRPFTAECFDSVLKPHFAFEGSEHDIIPVMTYAKFGSVVQNMGRPPDFYDYVICDELHSLMRYVSYKKGNENNRAAKVAIEQLVRGGETMCIALTATPDLVYQKMRCPYYVWPIEKSNLIQYGTVRTDHYTNISYLLRSIGNDRKGICFVSQIEYMKQYAAVAQENGLRTICVWSINNTDHLMTDEQHAAREYILHEEALPPDYDLVFINASSETGITIRGKIDYMVIHSRDKTTQVQVRGRYRDNLPQLYLPYEQGEEIFVVPEIFMGRQLFAEDKTLLCETLNLRNSDDRLYMWPTVQKRIRQAGYKIMVGRASNQRYAVIEQ
ncbi:DEAD/DEAH box helicase family protein [Eubacteriales bacterium OttesenSCG-928-A19]|nr:DEAD/DEAH box helicase family protein [Eubacteriales bacterium OttesenSCG-928-A19]